MQTVQPSAKLEIDNSVVPLAVTFLTLNPRTALAASPEYELVFDYDNERINFSPAP